MKGGVSGFTLSEACEYIRAQCGMTPAQIEAHRAAIGAHIRSGMSVIETCKAIREVADQRG